VRTRTRIVGLTRTETTNHAVDVGRTLLCMFVARDAHSSFQITLQMLQQYCPRRSTARRYGLLTAVDRKTAVYTTPSSSSPSESTRILEPDRCTACSVLLRCTLRHDPTYSARAVRIWGCKQRTSYDSRGGCPKKANSLDHAFRVEKPGGTSRRKSTLGVSACY
jgi:hypothetical protein